MNSSNVLSKLIHAKQTLFRVHKRVKRSHRRRLLVEQLENRRLLAVYFVSNINDTGLGSLRQAITDANANSGADVIEFNIGVASRIISLSSALPSITDPVVIDAATQPGYAGTPIVELVGTNAGSANGLLITGGNTTVRGLVIRNFSLSGILLSVGDNNVIEGNFIGTNLAGDVASPNARGIRIESGSSGNRIGTDGNGTNDAAERNLVSGNTGNGVIVTGVGSDNNFVAGNFIGVTNSGAELLGNGGNGISVSLGAKNTRLGTDGSNDEFNVNERNVISGNLGRGILVTDSTTTGTIIAGNFVGINAAGSAALGNVSFGIHSDRASSPRIGTNADGVADEAERNVISGNGDNGITIGGGVNEVFGLAEVDKMIAGTLSSRISNGTIAQADLSDTNGPSVGNWSVNNPIPGGGGDNFAVRVTGTLQVNSSGTFSFAIAGDEGGRLNIDGTSVIVDNSTHTFSARYGQVTLTAGTHSFEWVGFERTGGSGWELSVAVGPGNTSAISTANGWKVVGDPSAHPEIALNGIMQVAVYNSNQLISTSAIIAGNYIGLDATGTAAIGNFGFGGGIFLNSGATNNMIGGLAPGAGNVISGGRNSSSDGIEIEVSNDNFVYGNRIGTDKTGNIAIPNGQSGILIDRGFRNHVGGSAPGAANLISGNSRGGVAIGSGSARFNTVQGNMIGTNADGSQALGNGDTGISLFTGASDNWIGSNLDGVDDAAEGNLISGNVGGVLIERATFAPVNANSIAGNIIGVNKAGTAALPNGFGIRIGSGATNNVIGTNGDGLNDAIERNIISGNSGNGVEINDSTSSGNVVAGNWIGLNPAGTASLPNLLDGVVVNRAVAARIGTNGDGIADDLERNVISGNTLSGVRITGGVQEIFGLTEVDQMIAGTLPSRISTGTIAQADIVDTTNPSVGNWSFNNPVPGGGGDEFAAVVTGTLQVNTAGTFSFAISGNEGGRLKIDGTAILSSGSSNSFITNYRQVTLSAGAHTFEWIGFERLGDGGWELSVAVGASNTTAVTTANGWKVLGDPAPHQEISLAGAMDVTTYYSSQIVNTASVVAGNYIGTNANGLAAVPNAGDAGILVSDSAVYTRIGTDGNGVSDTLERNVISGNAQEGIQVQGASTIGTTIAGNYIGVDATGANGVGNGFSGVLVWGNATSTRVGGTTASQGNLIAFNTGAGLFMPDSASANSSNIGNNLFRKNALMGVDLGASNATVNDGGDSDGVRNTPVITNARLTGPSLIVEGFVRPGMQFELYETADYANGFGQGERRLASLTEGSVQDEDATIGSYGPTLRGVTVGTDTTNRFRFTIPLASLPSGLVPGLRLTAIAVGPISEFSSIAVAASSVVNRQIFYNRSSSTIFGNGSGNPVNAIDPTKLGLLPGQASSFANVSNYTRGLNGLVVDVANISGTPTASDFQFATWNGFSASGFVATTVLPTISVIPNGGIGITTRVKIEFSDNAIRNTWLRVTMLANATTGLVANDVFYFGNAVGDMNVGNSGSPVTVQTNEADASAVRRNASPSANSVPVSNVFDLNKDGRVNSIDTSLTIQNRTTRSLRFFTAPASLRLAMTPTSMATSSLSVPVAMFHSLSSRISSKPADEQSLLASPETLSPPRKSMSVLTNPIPMTPIPNSEFLSLSTPETKSEASSMLKSIDAFFAELESTPFR